MLACEMHPVVLRPMKECISRAHRVDCGGFVTMGLGYGVHNRPYSTMAFV